MVRADTTGLDVAVEADATDHGLDNLSPRLPALWPTLENYDPEGFGWPVRQTREVSDGEL